MTVTAEHGPLAEIAEEELINAFMSRDGDEERGIEHPLLLAMLMRHRRSEEDEPSIDHPLLLAMLMRRRRGGSDAMIEHPLLLAMLMRRRRGESGIGDSALAGALLGRH